jgi:regulatory protein
MKITAIKPQMKRDDRVSVFVDGKYSFSLSKPQLKEFKLEQNQQISEVELNSYRQESDDGKLFDRVLMWLARSPRSVRETRNYLKRKEATPEQTDRFVERLKKLRYLDDVSFAETFVRSRRQLKSRSQRKLRAELYQKGVDSKIIDKVLAEDETDEREVLKDLLEKKRKQSRYQDEQKLIAYAARKGFNYEDIKAALDELKEQT